MSTRRMEIIRQITGYETWYISIFFSLLFFLIENYPKYNHFAAMKIATVLSRALRDAQLSLKISIAISAVCSFFLCRSSHEMNAMIATSCRAQKKRKTELRCCF